MMRIVLFLLFVPWVLFAYIDSDMDGVEDSYDMCQNTLFSDLVDEEGCPIESLVSPHHFDILVGVNFSDSDFNTLSKTDTLTSSLQLDYFYKNFSLTLNTSYYTNKSKTYKASGLNDTYLGMNYQFFYNNFYISLGAGAVLPTYDTTLNNNNTDYTSNINLSYTFENINIYGVYGYTLVNDDDVEDVVYYQDVSYYSFGLGYYFTQQLYTGISYNNSQSVYKDVSEIETASLYGYYSIDENYFLTMSYAYGLSDPASDNSFTFQIGYYY